MQTRRMSYKKLNKVLLGMCNSVHIIMRDIRIIGIGQIMLSISIACLSQLRTEKSNKLNKAHLKLRIFGTIRAAFNERFTISVPYFSTSHLAHLRCNTIQN